MQATLPYPGRIVSGVLDIPVKLTLHDQVGTTNWLRLQAVTPSGSNVNRWQQDVTMGPCHDCTQSMTISVDTSGWPTGRHEFRISLNVPDEQPNASGSQRMFQSTGWQVCVNECSPTYRSGDFIEARGWYLDHEYQNARLTTPLSSVRSGGTIGVSLKPGSGGLPTVFAGVYIDPNFHAGDLGIVVREWSGPFVGNVTLPALPSGTHNLVLVAHDGQNAGVLRIPFEVN